MPFYDYRCETCKHEEFDVKRNITENVSIYICPKCQSEMHQIIHSFGFKLKGKGWFKDGYSMPNATEKKDAAK